VANVIQFTLKGVDGLSSTFGKATKSVAKAAKATVKAAARVGKVAALAFTAAATATVLFLNKIANAQDKVGKLSTRLGIAVDKLSEFHFAAKLGGVEANTFDLALQRMTRRIAEAAEGSGEAKTAIAELGLNARDLASIPLDQQMNVVADSLLGVESQSDKVRLAFKLFDSEGVSVLQTMQKGSQSFKDAAADLAFLGGTMDAQGVANAEKYKDSMLRVTTALGGTARAVGNELIPMVTGLANQFADFVANSRGNIVLFVKSAIKNILTFGNVVAQVFNTVGNFFSRLFDLDTTADVLNEVTAGFKEMFVGILNMAMDIAPFLARIFVSQFKIIWTSFGSFAENAWHNIKSLFDDDIVAKSFGDIISEAAKAASAEMDVLIETMGGVSEIVLENADSTGTALKEMFGINTELASAQAEAMIEQLSVFGEAVEEIAVMNAEKVSGIMDFMREQSELFLSNQKSLTEEFAKSLFATMMNTTKAIGQGVGEVIVEGEKASKVFKQIAKNVLKEVIATFVAMQIQRKITSALTIASVKTEASAEVGKAAGLAAANTLASVSAAPWPISLTAPVVAASHGSQALAQFGSFSATGSSLGASVAAHGGLGFVPEETTVLVNKGERIISPKQNADLTDFLDAQGSAGGGTSIGNIEIQINTSAERFEDISDIELEVFVSERVIPALDTLDSAGIRQAAIERNLD